MNLFLGSHQNTLDAKGRVSIPADFRSTLRKKEQVENSTALVLRPSHILPCIEGWPTATFNQFTEPLKHLDLFSTEQNDMAMLLYAQAWPVDLDREGRILLPEILKEHANLTSKVTFMGLGTIFQIWEPEAAKKQYEKALQHTKITLSPNQPQSIDIGKGQAS